MQWLGCENAADPREFRDEREALKRKPPPWLLYNHKSWDDQLLQVCMAWRVLYRARRVSKRVSLR